MVKRHSIQRLASRLTKEDKKTRDALAKQRSTEVKFGRKNPKPLLSVPTVDSFINYAQNLGVGADNALSSSGYGFNPITRVRTTLEWIHRGSWLGGVAVDLIADDMTRAGIEHEGIIKPKEMSALDEFITTYDVWGEVNDYIKWKRLYGGAIAVIMIDGQDPKTPLRIETVGKNQFRGLFVLDRWMVDPSINDLVQEPGPSFGLPKFYTVLADAPGLVREKIHYSRCIRGEGVRLPYWQRVMEMLWGISVLERLYDRMVAFDSATTGAAQLVYKSYIRTYKIDGLKSNIASGGKSLESVVRYVDMMRRFQGIEGITLIDGKDELTAASHNAFSGLSDALLQFGQQLSGALQIPLVRLFGQSPSGLNSSGDSDLRTYYDMVAHLQMRDLKVQMTRIYRIAARSIGIKLDEGYGIKFRSLWQTTDTEKAAIATSIASAISSAESGGLISQKTGLQELKQSSKITGIFTNITDEEINAAEESLPPAGEEALKQQQEHEKSAAELSGAKNEEKEEGKPGGIVETGSGEEKEEKGEEKPKKEKTKGKDATYDSPYVVSEMKRIHDIDIVIENPSCARHACRARIETSDETAYEVTMPYHYGYIRRTAPGEGMGPKEQIDCMIGLVLDSPEVFRIKQVDPITKRFDEYKVLFGYTSLTDALADYLTGYTDKHGTARIGGIDVMSMLNFKKWLVTKIIGDTEAV